MKTFIVVILFLGCAQQGIAQNVGIGTSAPTERLHVVQTADANKNVIYGYASQTSGSTDFENTAIAGFGQGNGTTDGYGYGVGVKGIGSLKSYGAVGVYAGLGTTLPVLSLGNRFYALYADALSAAGNHYAAVFMNGNTGVGTTAPEYLLDVADRMRLRSGPSGAAGIWYNIPDNSLTAGFIGTFNNTHLGMYGTAGAAWALVMNTTNGNIGIGNGAPTNKLDVSGNLNFTGLLKLNGNAGSAGQVLQSNGVGISPTWVSPAKAIFENSIIVTQNANAISNSGTPVDIPHLTHTFTANGPMKALISFAVNVEGVVCGFCANSKAEIIIVVDGSQDCTYRNASIENGAATSISGTFLREIFSAGSHTIKLQLRWTSGPTVAAYAPELSNYLSVVLFPQ